MEIASTRRGPSAATASSATRATTTAAVKTRTNAKQIRFDFFPQYFRCQFHQHFTSRFCANIFATKIT